MKDLTALQNRARPARSPRASLYSAVVIDTVWQQAGNDKSHKTPLEEAFFFIITELHF